MTDRQHLPPEHIVTRYLLSKLCPFSEVLTQSPKTQEPDMKFPQCTVVSINLPNELLAMIDALATQRIQNRSAYIRELVTEALRNTERQVLSPRPYMPE